MEMVQIFIKAQLALLMLISLPAGYSPFSPCERLMAPLSKQLTGVVLEHKYHGSHLNASKETINVKLEKKNFEHSGKRLAKLFEEKTLDKHATVASYVNPPANIDQPALKLEDRCVEVTEEWLCNHVQTSKYCFQVVACNNDNCCPNRPSHVKHLQRPLLPNGFLPPPVKYAHKFKSQKLPLAFSTKDMLSKTVKFFSLPSLALSHHGTNSI